MADHSQRRVKPDSYDQQHHDGSSPFNEDSPGDPTEEIHEWMNVNRRLRKHGLSSIRVLPSQDVTLNSGRYVCIDLESSQSLRTSVTSLITEIDRKENMLQDLTQANQKLKEEISQLTEEAETVSSKAKDIKVMLECSRARVQELEEDRSRSSSHYVDESDKLRNLKSAMSVKVRQLEAKVAEQEKELDRLRREIHFFAQEDERRSKRQNEVFMEFKKRTSRAHSAVDQNYSNSRWSPSVRHGELLDIIDSYESQIYALQKQLEAARIDHSVSRSDDVGHSYQHSNNFKGIIQSYEKQLRQKDKKIRALEEEKDLVRVDFGSRPETQDYRVLAQRVKKLENLLSLHSIAIPGEKQVRDPFARKKKFSTRLEDLDYLPLEQCHGYLRELCQELETDNLDCLTAIVRELKDEGDSSDRFQEYCRELSEIVESLNEHNRRHRLYGQDRETVTTLCDSNMRYYLEVVDNWRKDIAALGDLQESINRLLDKTVPWMRAHMDRDRSVSEMVELIEQVLHADKTEAKPTLMEDVSRSTLESIVSHFQTLFDVPRISGIFPRMNEIYRVLGESKNVMNTLKNLLGLSADAHSSALVDAVGKLCHMHNSTTAKQLKKLMQTDDLNGVIRRLDEHTEFFPAFQGIMTKLFDILGVDRMDEVIPAVRALKLLAK